MRVSKPRPTTRTRLLRIEGPLASSLVRDRAYRTIEENRCCRYPVRFQSSTSRRTSPIDASISHDYSKLSRGTYSEGIHTGQCEQLESILGRSIPRLPLGPIITIADTLAGKARECAVEPRTEADAIDVKSAVVDGVTELPGKSDPEGTHRSVHPRCP